MLSILTQLHANVPDGQIKFEKNPGPQNQTFHVKKIHYKKQIDIYLYT